ncbi:MAG TPA: hypothetical protein VG013_11520 [Gemmataceae bacterium]|nr:hypothetical protein [Gemmataceae bacterium]
MNQVVQAKCPGCRKVLRIPAAWIAQSLRCKHCGMIVQAKGMSAAPHGQPGVVPPSAAVPQPSAITARPAPAFVPHAPVNADPFAFDGPFGGASTAAPASAAVQERFPVHAGPSPPTTPNDTLGIILPSYRRRSGGAGRRFAAAAVVLCLLIGAGVLAVRAGWWDSLRNQLANKASPTEHAPVALEKTPGLPPDLPHDSADFPRRALAVSVSNYWYANPVAYGDNDRAVGAVLRRLAEALYIPKKQVFELGDGGTQPVAPTKEVIKNTITDFLNTSRAQDRIILLFVGHAVDVGGEPYLVPIDGDLTAKDTLLPLKWLYDGLARCKARQKVLILDVCRFDPSRGLERPGSGPMKPKIDAALQNPPPGVQVWSACVAKQYSHEGMLYTADGNGLHVGFFLSELYEAVGPSKKKRVIFGIQHAGDPLPIETLAKGKGKGEAQGVDRGTAYEADYWVTAKQTPRLSGRENPGGTPYDPQEKEPAQVVIRKPAPPPGGPAGTPVVRDILDETGAAATREGSPTLTPATMPLFDAKVLERYKDDGQRTPLRKAIIKARDALARHSQTFQEEFRGKGDDAAVKKLIYDRQKPPALAMEDLKEAMEDLQGMREESGKDKSRRWQADYEFILAKLEQRFAYANEYNYMLGRIRKDAMPPRDPNKYGGWRLAAQEKLHPAIGKEGKDMAADAKKRFLKLAKTYKGTPWAFLGKREALAALGLEWQVTP